MGDLSVLCLSPQPLAQRLEAMNGRDRQPRSQCQHKQTHASSRLQSAGLHCHGSCCNA